MCQNIQEKVSDCVYSSVYILYTAQCKDYFWLNSTFSLLKEFDLLDLLFGWK